MTRVFVLPDFEQAKGEARSANTAAQRECKKRLVKMGGRRLSVNLPPEAVMAVRRIRVRDGLYTDKDAIVAALMAFAGINQ